MILRVFWLFKIYLKLLFLNKLSIDIGVDFISSVNIYPIKYFIVITYVSTNFESCFKNREIGHVELMKSAGEAEKFKS